MLTKFRKFITNKKGFTFIELIVAMAIVAVVTAAALPDFLKTNETSRITSAKSSVSSITTAIMMFQADCGEYPATIAVLKAVKPAATAPVTATDKGPWLTNQAGSTADPWGTAWIYDSATGLVKSAGPDKTEGTADDIQM